jgi:hypothetical protein
MGAELLLVMGILLLVWGYIARLALGALDSLVPAFARMRRGLTRHFLKRITAPKEKRGVLFWLFVFLPAVAGVVGLLVVLATGEGVLVFLLDLVFVIASFLIWRTLERARRRRFALPGRRRRRR